MALATYWKKFKDNFNLNGISEVYFWRSQVNLRFILVIWSVRCRVEDLQ